MTTWAGLTVTIATKVLLCISAASPFDNESNQHDTAPHIMWVHTVHGIEYISYNNLQGAQVAQWVRSLDLTAQTSLSPIRRGFAPSFVIYKKGCTRLAAASDKVYQLLAQGRWFSPGTLASSTTKTGCHDIAEILLKVALKHQKINHYNNLPLQDGLLGVIRQFMNGNGLAEIYKYLLYLCQLHLQHTNEHADAKHFSIRKARLSLYLAQRS